MTIRPVFEPKAAKPYYTQKNTEFDYNPGLAPAQKKKNVAALHEAYLKDNPDKKVLEVSTKSEEAHGQAASPFNLDLELETLHKTFPVENIYQASKVFEYGGPYYDLLGATPLEAKRDCRLLNSGKLVYYQLEDTKYPSFPPLLFYTWLYIQAMMAHPSLAKEIMQYDAYTDIEFNPENENCQAKACAIFHALKDAGKLNQAKTFEGFKALFMDEDLSEMGEQKSRTPQIQTMPVMPKKKKQVFVPGDWIYHPSIGRGEVIRRDSKTYTINFNISGPRTITKDYVESHCRKI